jgi:hypothetical protein
MERCSHISGHLLDVVDESGPSVCCKCVRCGERICGNYFELKKAYKFVQHPTFVEIVKSIYSQKPQKETVIIAYVIGGILVLASIAATIGAIWEIYFNR